MVQEAYFRAFRFFGGMRGATSRAWLLRIVRNVCYDHLRKRQVSTDSSDSNQEDLPDTGPSPEAVLETKSEIAAVRKALANLPEDFRTVLVLREMQKLSYLELSAITLVPTLT